MIIDGHVHFWDMARQEDILIVRLRAELQRNYFPMGMILVGLLWLMLDRVLFAPLERRTVARWGLLQR